MGVCHEEGMAESDVEAFCQSVPDCADVDDEVDPSSLGCYMRCEDELDEDQRKYICGEYGMVCHMGLACVLPPVTDEDEDEDEAAMGGLVGKWGQFDTYNEDEVVGDAVETGD